MRIGITVFLTDRTIDPVTLAVEAEARGFQSLYFPEHTHIPVSRVTAPPTGDPELKDEYRRTMDPLIAIGAAASVTKKLVLGTGVSLVAQHDPLVMAKQLATLDALSGGRVTLGVGFGWNQDEMADHGVQYATRRAQAREHVLAMMELWSKDEAAFTGTYVNFPPSWSWPKPGGGKIRMLVGGGAGPKLFAQVAEYADGWFPIGGAGVREAIPRLQAVWDESGRTGVPEVVPFGVLPDPGKLDYYRTIGCSEVVLRVEGLGRDAALRQLDQMAFTTSS
ncbi:MAG: putative F420-dependent oxidoreductase, Rv2161c family [Ilumatobacteraceae bacterium]|nr:putative F420-dependent oxidoreductase, Rv2161c family [Ilumatobacteraceae bacterium]MCU1386693.1 putative F420-dependent oxidoreductase, Rv2161c family [Ilumatobacteraceae bacterium]